MKRLQPCMTLSQYLSTVSRALALRPNNLVPTNNLFVERQVPNRELVFRFPDRYLIGVSLGCASKLDIPGNAERKTILAQI